MHVSNIERNNLAELVIKDGCQTAFVVIDFVGSIDGVERRKKAKTSHLDLVQDNSSLVEPGGWTLSW